MPSEIETNNDQQEPANPTQTGPTTSGTNAPTQSSPIPTPKAPQPPASSQALPEVQFMPLNTFAEQNADKYGVELMGGFFHVQQKASHFADNEENWHRLMAEFSGKEVK